MSYYVIVRGPAGVGKSAVAKRLAKSLGATYVSFDAVMEKHGLAILRGEGIPAKRFLQGNRLVIANAKTALHRGRPVIFDGCFYHKQQLADLEQRLLFPHTIFTLDASLAVCLKRNQKRKQPLAPADIRAVYRLVGRVRAGTPIKTSSKSIETIVREIRRKVSAAVKMNFRH